MIEGKYFYKGWLIALCSFVTYMIIWGGVWYSFSVFYNTFVRDYHWGKGETGGVFSVCIGLVFAFSPIAGKLLDRYGPGRVLPSASLFLATNLFLCSRIDSIIGFYLFYGLGCGIGMSFVTFTPQTSIISRWFQRYRGSALGFALSGGGIGMLLFVPLIHIVVANYGWRIAFMLLSALVFFVIFPINLFLVRFPNAGETDQEKGLPYISSSKKNGRKLEIIDRKWASKSWQPREALKTKQFWFLCFAGICGTALVVQTTFSHFILMTTERGFSAGISSNMLGLSGIMGTAGFLFWGRLSDSFSREYTFTLGSVCLFCGFLLLFFMEWVSNIVMLFFFAILFGFGYGSRAPLTQSICADLFQGPHLSSIYGMYQASLTLGVFGPWFAGVLSEKMDSYQPIILFLMGTLILSSIFVWLAGPRRIRAYNRESSNR